MNRRVNTAANALFGLFQTVGGGLFRSCGIPNCQHKSLGLICKRCSRFMCQRHAYARPTVPPKLVCASCVIGEHTELLEEDGVIDAEIVE